MIKLISITILTVVAVFFCIACSFKSESDAGLLGGNISAKSESGRGSEFTFTMPLRCQEEKQNEIDN